MITMTVVMIVRCTNKAIRIGSQLSAKSRAHRPNFLPIYVTNGESMKRTEKIRRHIDSTVQPSTAIHNTVEVRSIISDVIRNSRHRTIREVCAILSVYRNTVESMKALTEVSIHPRPMIATDIILYSNGRIPSIIKLNSCAAMRP